jgi:hypothetical protein
LLEAFEVPAARGTWGCDAEYAARKISGLVSESFKASGRFDLPTSTKRLVFRSIRIRYTFQLLSSEAKQRRLLGLE